ncbi:hypothetical protein INT43_006630 [Umbelopsis isabellina]|uniref:NADH:flavin oxidoreductase/NADH oxidase N-terminal domain-containing protein n=1 Tax=Mortierella isabellina TaxID=91625 RepID=A0A8H7UJ40_MORIS|nr:hypothetical protein INT43_006630 [Umbelopsis isabellina]
MAISSNSNLFKPIKLGNKTLKHRVAMAPLSRFRADDDNVPTELAKTYYEQRASDGGLIIGEGTFVSELAGHWPNVPGIYNDNQIKGWKNITDAVHAKGGIIYCQLGFMGRADSIPSVSASAIAMTSLILGKIEPSMPRALEVSEIREIVDMHAKAALNAIEAGFDGVEIHGASGYLLDQFMHSGSNKRTDQYGGSTENRLRIVLEVIEAISSAIGQDRVGIRLSPFSDHQEMEDDNPVETWSILTQSIQDRFPHMSYLHFIESRVHGNSEDSLDVFQKIWKGTFLRAGGFTPESAAEATDANARDVIVFGRHFISNPDLPLRIQNAWPLSHYNRDTFYLPKSPLGYTDYPIHEESSS